MSASIKIDNTTAIEQSGIQQNTPAGDVAVARNTIFAMTQEAEDAVLRPSDSGAWSHALRAALACRCAQANKSSALAQRYFGMIGTSEYEPIADLENDGSDLGLTAVIQFMDRVATCPRDVTADDISALQQAGITDADIVRLSGLNAFMAYQIRLVSGLALLAGNPV